MEARTIFTVHETLSDETLVIAGVRETLEAATALANEVFNVCECTDVWVEAWQTDGPWYDSIIVYRKEWSE